jgi:hypothetical protein
MIEPSSLLAYSKFSGYNARFSILFREFKIENICEGYLEVSVDNAHTMAVPDSVNNWPDSVGSFFLRIVLLLDNSVK